MDHNAFGDIGEGVLFAIPSDGSAATPVISNLRMGTPGGVSLTAGGLPVKLKCPAQPAARSGDNVFLSFQAEAAHLFDPQSGARL